MPVKASFDVEGLKELHTQLALLEENARRGFQREAMKAAMRPVINAARRYARRRTGKGAKSIRGRIITKGGYVEGRISFSKKHFYMRFQETGTRHHAASPFLRPALDTQAQAAIEAFKQRMSSLVEEATKTRLGGEGEEDVDP